MPTEHLEDGRRYRIDASLNRRRRLDRVPSRTEEETCAENIPTGHHGGRATRCRDLRHRDLDELGGDPGFLPRCANIVGV
jgi:hypothetical protein